MKYYFCAYAGATLLYTTASPDCFYFVTEDNSLFCQINKKKLVGRGDDWDQQQERKKKNITALYLKRKCVFSLVLLVSSTLEE